MTSKKWKMTSNTKKYGKKLKTTSKQNRRRSHYSGALILNQRVKNRTGVGLVLNQTKSHLVVFIETKPKANHFIFSISKLKQNKPS
jgi:hypothetical protein